MEICYGIEQNKDPPPLPKKTLRLVLQVDVNPNSNSIEIILGVTWESYGPRNVWEL